MIENVKVSHAPHISKAMSTRSVMLDVIIALVPAMIMAGLYFRMRALILIGTCVITCVVVEWLCNVIRKKPNSLGDLSAVLTGIILALSVPPALPFWAAIIGSAFAIAIGKMRGQCRRGRPYDANIPYRQRDVRKSPRSDAEG